jgi:hypothetical protein
LLPGQNVDEAMAVGDGATTVVDEVDESELIPTSCWGVTAILD